MLCPPKTAKGTHQALTDGKALPALEDDGRVEEAIINGLRDAALLDLGLWHFTNQCFYLVETRYASVLFNYMFSHIIKHCFEIK